MLHQEGFSWSNESTSQDFVLVLGGNYLLAAHATWSSGNVQISVLASDNSTYVPVANTKLTADGALSILLSPGSYQLTITTATAVYASVARCPVE